MSDLETIKEIIIYSGTLKLISEFNSSSITQSEVTDHPLVRDMEDRVMLRGESFAGLIRQELVRHFDYKCMDYTDPGSKNSCPCEVCKLMGASRIPSNIPSNSQEYRASRLKVTGGVFKNSPSRIRHGVAIERKFQVAAQHKKYDLEVLLPNASASFSLEMENPTKTESAAVEQALTEMQHEMVALGGKRGAGYGAFHIQFEKYTIDLNNSAHLVNYLLYPEKPLENGEKEEKLETSTLKSFGRKHGFTRENGEKEEKLETSEAGGATESRDLNHLCDELKTKLPDKEEDAQRDVEPDAFLGWRSSLPFNLTFPELFLVNDPLESSLLGSDHISVIDRDGNPWLPSSTIRGVLRSRGEQILRTLNPISACDPSCDLEGDPLESCTHKIQTKQKRDKSQLTLDDLEKGDCLCMGCQLFGSTLYASRLRFLSGQYDAQSSHQEILQHFLAIDRFTGGGKDGAKYDAYPLYNVSFLNCKLVIENFKLWQIGLLSLIFKDLLQEDLYMGFGSRKGFGKVIGDFNMNEAPLLLSKSNKFYQWSIKTLFEKNEIKTWLQDAVDEFRSKIKTFRGNDETQ